MQNFQSPIPLTIQHAHRKGDYSTNNGRDSPCQRLGVKIYGDQDLLVAFWVEFWWWRELKI
ncbi:unnamed protein product [Arabidopsis lyrata]|nr:unnamed protein product [Arabidopsis lyrata]